MGATLTRWLWTLAVMLPVALFSQGINNLNFDLRLLNAEAQIFPMGDFGFISGGDIPVFFLIELRNTGEEAIEMSFRIDFLLNGNLIANGRTDRFCLPGIGQAQSSLVFNNNALETGIDLPIACPETAVNRIQIRDYDTDNLDQIGNLEDQVLTTGRIPAGEYQLLMTVFAEDGSGASRQDEISDNNTLLITNPTTVQRLFPGMPVGDAAAEEVYTTFPFLQWYSDVAPGTENFNLTVWKKLDSDRTVQDVLNNPPVLQVEGLGQSFIQYPATATPDLLSGRVVGSVRLLEYGSEYYWQVNSLVPTGTGVERLDSDVYRFRVVSPSQGGSGGDFDPRLLAFLEQILGPQYQPVLRALRDEGFQPNGTIMLDGTPIDINDLMLLIGRLVRGDSRIRSVEVY